MDNLEMNMNSPQPVDDVVDNGVEDVEVDEALTVEDEETPPQEEGQEELPENQPQDEIVFDEKQQAKINEIVKSRLERYEATWAKRLSEAAGVQLDVSNGGGEILDAARLWGFLKVNPEISETVQKLIDSYYEAGAYNQPEYGLPKEQQLELKEAVLDLKASDSTFAKNYDAIMEWAETNGFEVRDKQTLNLAYLAWKGANVKKELANAQLNAQRKAQAKAVAKQQAQLATSKARSKGTLNYVNMSDRDILANEGLSLFIDE